MDEEQFWYWAKRGGVAVAALVGTIIVGDLAKGYMREKGLDWEKIGSELAKDRRPETTGTVKPHTPKVTRPRQPTARELEIQRCEEHKSEARLKWAATVAQLAKCTEAARQDFIQQFAPSYFCKAEFAAEAAARDVRQKAVEREC